MIDMDIQSTVCIYGRCRRRRRRLGPCPSRPRPRPRRLMSGEERVYNRR